MPDLRSKRSTLTELSEGPSTTLPPPGTTGRGKKRRQIDQEGSQKRARLQESSLCESSQGSVPPSHQPEPSRDLTEVELLAEDSEVSELESSQAPCPTELQRTNQDSQRVVVGGLASRSPDFDYTWVDWNKLQPGLVVPLTPHHFKKSVIWRYGVPLEQRESNKEF